MQADGPEAFTRIGLGTPDVLAAVKELRERGVLFAESPKAPVNEHGAMAAGQLFGLSFELVHATR